MEKILHIVLTQSNRWLKDVFRKEISGTSDYIYIPLQFSWGYRPKNASMKEMYRALCHIKYYKQSDYLAKIMSLEYSKYDKVIIYHSNWVIELLGLYFVCKFLNLKKCDVYEFDMEYFCDAKGLQEYRCGRKFVQTACIPPSEYEGEDLFQYAKPCTKEKIAEYSKQWDKWAKVKNSYILNNPDTGELEEVARDFFDQSIDEAVRDKKKFWSVIHQLLTKYELICGQIYMFADRLQELFELEESRYRIELQVKEKEILNDNC